MITRKGDCPVNKKVEVIMNMKKSTTKRGLKKFIVLVNDYRNMWTRRSHTLKTLNKLTPKKVKFKRIEI